MRRSGVDSLAVSVGNMHGLTKVVAEAPGGGRNAGGSRVFQPGLRFGLIEDIQRRVPGFPLVLHGASSVLGRYAAMINEHGGAVKDAVGIPEEQIRRAAGPAGARGNVSGQEPPPVRQRRAGIGTLQDRARTAKRYLSPR